MNAPLRRTRGDLIATGVIAGISALLVGAAFFTAPARDAHLAPPPRGSSRITVGLPLPLSR